jgi:ribosomal protein L37AE/L43A
VSKEPYGFIGKISDAAWEYDPMDREYYCPNCKNLMFKAGILPGFAPSGWECKYCGKKTNTFIIQHLKKLEGGEA